MTRLRWSVARLAAALGLGCLTIGHGALAQPPVPSTTAATVTTKRAEAARAARAGSIRLDGVLDENAWREAKYISDFTQREPSEGDRRPTLRASLSSTTTMPSILARDCTAAIRRLSAHSSHGAIARVAPNSSSFRWIHSATDAPPTRSRLPRPACAWTTTSRPTSRAHATTRTIRSGKQERRLIQRAGRQKCASRSANSDSARPTNRCGA